MNSSTIRAALALVAAFSGVVLGAPPTPTRPHGQQPFTNRRVRPVEPATVAPIANPPLPSTLMLLLFDIDSTLTDTSSAGIKSLRDAGRDHFGPQFTIDGVAFSGRLDPLIIADLLAVNAVADTADHRAALQRGYAAHLARYLAQPNTTRALPGVLPLLDAVANDARAVPALLTGNFQLTGTMKLRACGIDPARFRFGVWGDEAPRIPPRREDLVPVAFDRCRALASHDPDPRRAVVIGDTPHDVSCAREHGLRCLAVATGKFSLADLEAAGAHRALPTLENTSEILAWLAQ